MWPASVVVLPRILHGEEQAGVETFVSQPTVEAFDKPILHWFAGTDKVELHLVFICPNGRSRELFSAQK